MSDPVAKPESSPTVSAQTYDMLSFADQCIYRGYLLF